MPFICLALLMFIRSIGVMLVEKSLDKLLYLPFPYIFNLDYKTLTTSLDSFSVTSCEQWYMHTFDPTVSQKDREFFGHNSGVPMNNPDAEGMLSSKNLMSYPCRQINKTVPYFKEFNNSNYPEFQNMNEYLYDALKKLSDDDLIMTSKIVEAASLPLLPDGALTIKEVNAKKLKYNIQINDARYW